MSPRRQLIRMRAESVPALDEPPPATVEPGPVAEAVVLELALLVCLKLELEEVGVVVLEVETFVLALVEHEPDADRPPLARKPQSDLAQLLLIVTLIGLAGRVRLARPTVPRPPLRVAASASVATSAVQPSAAANIPMVTRRMSPSRTLSPSSITPG